MIPKRQVSRTLSLPSPVGGWNARDSIAEMKPDEAVILDNFYCLPSMVQLRSGYTQWATGLVGNVESLIAYESPTATKLFACANGGIYDVTSSGAVGAAAISGLANNQRQSVNFGTAGGNYNMSVNGADKLRYFDGTTWTTDTGVAGPYGITGFDTALAIHINVFKQRVWLIEKSSLRVWYLPSASIAGAAASIDLSSLFKMGGYLMAMGTWTLDAGTGLDDFAVFITSRGEVAVYQGTDPTSATTWALKGVYYMGSPMGRRCYTKYGGNLLIISKDGLFPLSQALMSSRVSIKSSLTDKIQYAISNATSLYASNYGWETFLFPGQNMLWVNVPVSSTEAHQYVMNTITGAWSRFKGWNAYCWALSGDQPYFGGNGFVGRAWYGAADNNANINTEALQAFNSFGAQSQLKRFTMVRPIITYDNAPGILLGLNVDYDTTAPSGTPSFSTSSSAVWDTAVWDSGIWGGGLDVHKEWQGVNGIGYSAAMHIITASKNSNIQWASTTYVYEQGGIL